MSVGFRLLGDIEVWAGDEPIDVGHARQRCVLAVLLLSANRVVPVESLIERVWGPRPPRSARNTLHSYLVRLRHALATCDGVEIVRREAALAAAREGADPAALALAYRTLGYAHADAGHTGAALSNLDTALGLAAGDVTTQAYIHHSLARAHDQAGDGPTAMRHARLALDLHRAAGNDVGAARAGADVGWLAASQGHHAEARRLSGEALELVRSMGMGSEGEAACLDTLGYVAHETGDHAAGLRYYTEALANYETVGDAYSIADTHDHLARTHAALGDTGRARDHGRQALQLYDTQLRVANADRIRAWLATLP